MFKKIKQKLAGSEEKKRLIGNIFSLGMLQWASYILPLLTIPYLVRVLGPEYFGLLAFATATVTYFVLFTDYGFNLSVTRQISINRQNPDRINEIFSSVMIVKIGLLIISIGLLSLFVFSLEKFSQHWEIYFLTFGIVIGQVLFPIWLFQGMETMKFVAYINLMAKGLATLTIFVFVQSQDDYWLVPLLTSIGFIAAGGFSLYLARKQFGVVFLWPTMANIGFQLKEGGHIFYSTLAISLYTVSTTFILGLLTNNTVVGYFSAADKIVQAVKGLYQPVAQALFPHVGKKFHDSPDDGVALIKKMTLTLGGGMFLASAFLYVFADTIVFILLGSGYQDSVELLQIMAFLPFLIVLSNVFGIQAMLNMGFERAFSYIVLLAAIIGGVGGFAVIPSFGAVGMAYIMLLVEIFVTLSMYWYLKSVVKVL